MELPKYPNAVVDKMNNMHVAETIAPHDIRLLWIRLVYSSDKRVEIFPGEHRHTFCEVHICLDGKVTYEFPDGDITLNELEGVVIAPNTKHTYSSENKQFIKCSLAFTAESESPFYQKLQALGAAKFNFPPDAVEALKIILKEADGKNCFSAKIAHGRAFETVYTVLRCIDFDFPLETENDVNCDPRLDVAKKYINSNPDKMLSCEDVARECGLSVKQLGRIFKKYTDQSLSGYIKGCKLKACEEMLTDSRYTVKEVGYMLGFENEYSFNSFFKRHYGMPPGAFRKTNTKPRIH